MADRWNDRRHYSWLAFQDALAHGVTHPKFTGSLAHCDVGRDESWDLNYSYADVQSLVAGVMPWPLGRERIEQTAREQAAQCVARRGFSEEVYDTVGDYFDIPSVIEGLPECWIRQEQTGHGAPSLVRFIVDMTTSVEVSADTMVDRLVAVTAAALVLEATGHPIEVIAMDTTMRYPTYCTTVQLCNAGEPIDTTRLTAIAHPATYRRGFFRLIEITPSARIANAYSASYGHVDTLPDDVLTEEFGLGCVYIPPCRGRGDAMQPTCEALLRIVRRKLGYVGIDDYTGEETTNDE